jgi:hypothetical protein
MIPAPVVLAAVGLVAWAYEVRSRRAYEATLSPAEKRQFRAYCRVNPSWRAFMRLKSPSANLGKASPLPVAGGATGTGEDWGP